MDKASPFNEMPAFRQAQALPAQIRTASNMYFLCEPLLASIASARRAASYGAKVALIEGHRLGGTCVNVGCVPKKMMHIAALLGESLEYAQRFGWDVKFGGFDWKSFTEKRDADIVRLNGIYERNLRNSNITIINGWAKFAGDGIDVNCSWAFDTTYCNQIILWCSDATIIVERAFSKPSSFRSAIIAYRDGKVLRKFETGQANHFETMFDDFALRIQSNDRTSVSELIGTNSAMQKVREFSKRV